MHIRHQQILEAAQHLPPLPIKMELEARTGSIAKKLIKLPGHAASTNSRCFNSQLQFPAPEQLTIHNGDPPEGLT